MANARNKNIDNTHLSIDQAAERGFIHRDYLAHCLRWSHVAKFMHTQGRYKTAHILDVGCGRDQPLPRMLYSSRLVPDTGSYTGVDYNKIEPHPAFHTGRFPLRVIGGVAYPDVVLPRDKFDVIVCFEVLEHVEPAHSLRMLKAMQGQLDDAGTCFISTPCYDAHVGAAANHVNEMSFKALGAMIELAGFHIVNVWGTFASQRDYKHLMSPAEKVVFDHLSDYYDSNYLATVFAPLHPEASRNCLWELRKTFDGVLPTFGGLKNKAGSEHSSSDQWPAFVEAL